MRQVSPGPHVPWGRALPSPISGGLAFPSQDEPFAQREAFTGAQLQGHGGARPLQQQPGGQVPNRFPSRSCLVWPLQPFHPRAPASPCRGPSLQAPHPLPGTPPRPAPRTPVSRYRPGHLCLLKGRGLSLCHPQGPVCAWGGGEGGVQEAKPSISRAHPGPGPEVAGWPAQPGLTWRRG